MTNQKTQMTFDTTPKPILKHYRTSMGIISEIMQILMDAGMGGVMVSELSRKSNLSYNATVDNCQKLIAATLVETSRRGRNLIFVMTPKGIEFFQKFKRFQEFTSELNLRY